MSVTAEKIGRDRERAEWRTRIRAIRTKIEQPANADEFGEGYQTAIRDVLAILDAPPQPPPSP